MIDELGVSRAKVAYIDIRLEVKTSEHVKHYISPEQLRLFQESWSPFDMIQNRRLPNQYDSVMTEQ
jgi:hypothetical protein